MNKCLVIFAEGDTELVFYKRIVAHATYIPVIPH